MSTCADDGSFIGSKTSVVQTSKVGFTSEVSHYLVVHTGPGKGHCVINPLMIMTWMTVVVVVVVVFVAVLLVLVVMTAAAMMIVVEEMVGVVVVTAVVEVEVVVVVVIASVAFCEPLQGSRERP